MKIPFGKPFTPTMLGVSLLLGAVLGVSVFLSGMMLKNVLTPPATPTLGPGEYYIYKYPEDNLNQTGGTYVEYQLHCVYAEEGRDGAASYTMYYWTRPADQLPSCELSYSGWKKDHGDVDMLGYTNVLPSAIRYNYDSTYDSEGQDGADGADYFRIIPINQVPPPCALLSGDKPLLDCTVRRAPPTKP